MWRFIVGLLATVGTLTLLGIGGCAAFLATGSFTTTKPLPIRANDEPRAIPEMR